MEVVNGDYTLDFPVILGDSLSISPEIHIIENIKESELTYQWYKISYDDGSQKTILRGETKKELIFSDIKEKDLGNYMLEISWGNGKKEVRCVVRKEVFQIGQSAYSAYTGMPVTYMGAYGASGRELDGASYQWYQYSDTVGEYTAIDGETDRTLTVDVTDDNKGISMRHHVRWNRIYDI